MNAVFRDYFHRHSWYCSWSSWCCVKGNQIGLPEHLQEILKRQQQQKVTSGTIAPATVAIQHIKVTKPSVSLALCLLCAVLFDDSPLCCCVLSVCLSVCLSSRELCVYSRCWKEYKSSRWLAVLWRRQQRH